MMDSTAGVDRSVPLRGRQRTRHARAVCPVDVDRRRAVDVPWVVGYARGQPRVDVDADADAGAGAYGDDAAETGVEEVAKDCSAVAERAAGRAVCRS